MLNQSNHLTRWGIWSVTQLNVGRPDGSDCNPAFYTYIPLNPDTHLPGGYRTMFGDAKNSQVDKENKLLRIKYEWIVGKVGLDSSAGWMANVDGTTGYVFLQAFTIYPRAEYPDGSSVEVWTNGLGTIKAWGKVMEMPKSTAENPYVVESELVSPYIELKPGQMGDFEYNWYSALDNGLALEQWNDEVQPEVVLLDLRMPRLSGIDCISIVLRRFPLARILIISSYDMDKEIFQVLEAGALGYISKSAPQEEMTRAIRAVHSGMRSLPPRVARSLQDRNHRDNLTARELEILKSVARGHTSRQIAGALHISEFTVRNHVNHIISKLHAQDRTDAAVIGLKKGFIRLEEV